jgi:uncharacterized repeat protein (TIGR03803 family)
VQRRISCAGAVLIGICLAGCGDSRGIPVGAPIRPAAAPQSHYSSGSETVLYSFQGGDDGEFPTAAPAELDGTLYGTTAYGGSSTCVTGGPGCGTIFELGVSGTRYRVLHRYRQDGGDGANPVAPLAGNGKTLYGTTFWGGGRDCETVGGCGTVFQLDSSGGNYRILFKFGRREGFAVYPGVAQADGMLYGATAGGGSRACAGGCGTLYRLGLSGERTILHKFAGGRDGDGPFNRPILVKSVLYGTTSFGGGAACTNPSGAGCGIVYSLHVDGSGYRVLYRFKGGKDGATPNNVIDVNDKLYGTTSTGGGTVCNTGSGPGCGTIFTLSTSGKGYRVLYRFKGGGPTGWDPVALLAASKGTLYGATTYGGVYTCRAAYGCGTVFRMRTSGKGYRVLHAFAGGSDGMNPYGDGPIIANGTLYGTTVQGGSTCDYNGCGTVYAITLP